ncbi:hypothetical protein V9T40_014674 [Parthenolecanium corni]|uniref:Uncharacterized protein n=1 Tax=Parthenolecanium corni TaxID=536013 RepID=A0AAN9XWZ3_9HEMI
MSLRVEDEWTEIQQRFKKEGIDFSTMRPDDRLIHIWRWLVDTEINLKNSRRMYDKLREQQNEELEAMENYLGQIREMSEKQTVDIENENKKMQDQLAHILSVISNIFNDEDAGNSITDKIDQFCSKYIKLTEEVQVLNKLKLNNPHSDDMIAEMITISTEKETLKREVAELNERMQLLQKSSRELELDNEKLAFKLSEAFAELEEKEIRSNREIFICSFSSDSNKSTLSRLDSEPINQTDKILSQGCRTESTSPSLILNDMTDYKSSSKLSSLMNSCHEMARLEENKKLQTECESMKSRISNLGEKYNNLALKYIQLKAKKKFQVEDLRHSNRSSKNARVKDYERQPPRVYNASYYSILVLNYPNNWVVPIAFRLAVFSPLKPSFDPDFTLHSRVKLTKTVVTLIAENGEPVFSSNVGKSSPLGTNFLWWGMSAVAKRHGGQDSILKFEW